jgi:hypothetical protein
MEVRRGRLDPILAERLFSLSDPRISPIYDIFALGFDTCLVSEHIDGVRLDQMEGLLSNAQIRTAGTCLCETVASLHQHGIYDMDLRFSNLRMIHEGPRLVSLSTSRTVDRLCQGERLGAAQKDLLRLTDTVEKLVAEFGTMGQSKGLGSLVLAIEDMRIQNRVSLRNLRKALKQGQTSTRSTQELKTHIGAC